ncbi:hypothetical protein GCM10008027_19800 [Pseudoalteromonas gelatinilytica]|uniref:Uncharacterized protein n=1 Tax=Pseudoalteromonas gelatinilytica TaxID=1703256 RepID=A0ABQ1TGD1_9GAMM|nr:hypothetical protein GCM10008027_19800 [Pseudoalteromonas profundi]
MIILEDIILNFLNVEDHFTSIVIVCLYFFYFFVNWVFEKFRAYQEIRSAKAKADLKELEVKKFKKDNDIT